MLSSEDVPGFLYHFDTLKKFKDMSIRRLQKKAGRGDSTLDMILMAAL
ncbi:hypothetical protein [Legionella moravica]|nr:hypothetical protein [Legionella moravica]